MTERPSYRHNFNYYAMYFMTFVYVALGMAMVTFLKVEALFETLSVTGRKIIGTVLIVYGIFRMFVLRKRYRK